MLWWLYPILIALILSYIFSGAVRVLAIRFGIVDAPDQGRKRHAAPTPLLGGLAIYASFVIAVGGVLYFTDHFTSGDITITHFIGLFIGGLILMIGGALDDLFNLKPWQSIIFPILAAVVAILCGLGVEKFTNPLGGTIQVANIISDAFTFFWIVGLIYTFKLLDGLDGLATGIGFIASMMMAALALTAAYFQPDVALLALIVAAALLGFLAWNYHPAYIFLGEGGSTFIGFLVATLAVISGSKVATALLVVGIPALDVVFVILNRLRRGDRLTLGDRSHLHHRLHDAGFSTHATLALYFTLALLFGLTTLFFESWQKVIALGVLFVIMILTLSFLQKKRV